ncbi:MAG TPA: phosphate/phosphite/phosphonate ABC transporter substrate-binding protein [bacterium]|nr:phosphate/phosphite/phosphonate ABC transporter substrate-binding protein [bacterium]
MTTRRATALALVTAVVIALVAAGAGVAPAQTKLVMAFVPSGEAATVLTSGNRIASLLGTATGYQFESFVATSYAGVIEAMGAGRADIGWLSTFAYVIAHQKYGVEVRLVTVRFGEPYYNAEIITQASSGINSLADLKGKRFAFVDPASTSGYLFPLAGLKKAGYDPSKFFGQTVFAGSHNNVVLAVYQGRVDAGAVFDDARGTVQKDYPDVMQKIKVIWKSDPIPNDTVSFRKTLPADVKDRVTTALLRFSQTPAGLDALKSLYEIEALADYQLLTSKYHVKTPNLDAFYNPVRDVATYAGVNLEELIKPH